jgi:hypothetical protein
VAPGVAGSIPVSHPVPSSVGAQGAPRGTGARVAGGTRRGPTRNRTKVRSSIGRAPVSKTGGWGFKSLRACWVSRQSSGACRGSGGRSGRHAAQGSLAVSSRGLGRSPLKAQTRVRIPLPLWQGSIGWCRCRVPRVGCRTGRFESGPFVYRLGRHPFTVQRGVRFPYGLSNLPSAECSVG